jgi:hypothetical protein
MVPDPAPVPDTKKPPGEDRRLFAEEEFADWTEVDRGA